MRLDSLERRIEDIKAKADAEICELLEAEIQIEFDKVHARKPQIKCIIFGNGTYAIDGYDKDPWKQTDLVQKVRGWEAQYKLSCPRYLRRLILMCETAAEYGIKDITPS